MNLSEPTRWLACIGADVVAAAVLSGNRNFEGRVHPLTRANYLASPPLVVAYAFAGTVGVYLILSPVSVLLRLIVLASIVIICMRNVSCPPLSFTLVALVAVTVWTQMQNQLNCCSRPLLMWGVLQCSDKFRLVT